MLEYTIPGFPRQHVPLVLDLTNTDKEVYVVAKKRLNAFFIPIMGIVFAFSLFGLSGAGRCEEAKTIKLEDISVRGKRGIDHPEVPAVVESLTAEDIEKINVVGVEDVVKYEPSLYVRKLGQAASNAPLIIRSASTRMTPRALVMADDLLLSNFLAAGHSYGPRWFMVAPEEIERIDVIYGPYSALYSGNAMAGALIMTTKFPDETHLSAKTTFNYQNYDLYQSDFDLYGYNFHASYGDQFDKWGLFLIADQLYYEEQPITFYTQNRSDMGAPVGNAVSGGVWDEDRYGKSRFVYGSAGPTEKLNNLFRIKLAYDLDRSSDLRFTMAYWEQNRDSNDPETYLTDSSGNKVYSGAVDTDAGSFTVSNSRFQYREREYQDLTYSLSYKRTPNDALNLWAGVSWRDSAKDLDKYSTTAPTGSQSGGTGRISETDSGWYTVDLKASPASFDIPGLARHTITGGYHYDYWYYDSEEWNASDWKNEVKTTLRQGKEGKTQTHALFVQDEWDVTDMFDLYLGARYEWWKAFDGRNSVDNGSGTVISSDLADRDEDHLSPKFALTFEPNQDWEIRFSAAWAYRFPTVGELFQETLASDGTLSKGNPDLKSEKAFSKDLTFARTFGAAGDRIRLSFYEETAKDVIWSYENDTTGVSNYQNMDEVRTQGIEFAFNKRGFLIDSLDFKYNIAFTDSKVIRNDANQSSVGKQFLRVPKWRSKILLTYYPTEDWTCSLGGRYASRGYNDIDNSDIQGGYGGVDDYLVFDTKIAYKFMDNWTASLAVDNITDEEYFVSHPYNMRTFFAEVQYNF